MKLWRCAVLQFHSSLGWTGGVVVMDRFGCTGVVVVMDRCGWTGVVVVIDSVDGQMW